MEKVIGIISYLPDDESISAKRKEKLERLVAKCNELFNLPIIIIAQNWKDYKPDLVNCKVFSHIDRLGIVGARRELRRTFLCSGYDYLIMLDDDCDIVGSKSAADSYLREIERHPSGAGLFKGPQLKLFAISKDIMSQVDFRDVNPENGEGFEDTLFVSDVCGKFANSIYKFPGNTDLGETSVGANDPLSTWFNGQDLKDMLRRTEELK